MQVQDKLKDEFKSSLIPSEYKVLSYIQNTGDSYYDTNYIASQDSKMYLEFEVASILYDNPVPIAGYYSAMSASSINTFGIHAMSASASPVPRNLGCMLETGATCHAETNESLKPNFRYIASLSKSSLVVNGVTCLMSRIPSSFKTTKSLYLFKVSGAATKYALIKVYACKLYENDRLMQDLVPAQRKSDSAFGFYDLCSQTFKAVASQSAFKGA